MLNQTALSREACDAQNIYCAGCCRGDPLLPIHHRHPQYEHHDFLLIFFIIMTKVSQDVQVAGESVLMVVGGDNLADNQESSLEIYNRSGSIKLELKLELDK